MFANLSDAYDKAYKVNDIIIEDCGDKIDDQENELDLNQLRCRLTYLRTIRSSIAILEDVYKSKMLKSLKGDKK